tara:strand:+ start:819 stop:1502 length:684 start_codon:yes stop_codon:yes gene_type:complete
MIDTPPINKNYNNKYIITKEDLKEIIYIKPTKSNLKYYLRKIYNELWVDEFERVDKDKQHYRIDYIIEDNNNNNNFICGNSNYIYQKFNNLFENNEYEFEYNMNYSTENKRVKPQIIKKKFSKKLLVRYIEIYFILHGYIKPLNIDLNILDMKENHALIKCLNNRIYNWFYEDEKTPLKITNKIIFYDDERDPKIYNYLDIVKDNYKYKFVFDNFDYLIKECLKVNR